MFTELNKILIQTYSSKLHSTDKNKNMINNRLKAFENHILKKEEEYKSKMFSTRRGNGIIERASSICNECGHRAIAIIPYIEESKSYMYHIIAYREFNNSYTVWTYNALSDQLVNFPYSYGNSIQNACSIIGLIL